MFFYLFIFSTLFLMCEKDKEIELNPVYGPAQERQFGEESALVQELSFNSDGFYIVGDFITPVDEGTHPVIIMIHGSGSATRYGAVPFNPLIEIFLRNGFAVLCWDKPGSGESTGEFEIGYTITGRAKILVDATRVMLENPSIDNSSIGLWGISQAGWVMPKALDMTSDIAFMIVVSGGAEDGIEQFSYQVGQVAACAGETAENVEKVDMYWSQMQKATTYSEYKEAADFLVTIQSIVDYTGVSVSEENSWNAWPRNIDAFFNPMDVIEHTTIPVLVFFGELDKNIDPVQGAHAYQSALEASGNQDYRIEVIEGAGHVLAPAQTVCLDEFVGSEYVPEYLEILEEWLSDR
ncbi:MAG: alpha/beta fold hydrolase [Bacteroidales bacterium]|nr:MAG: alpha/beta fold hydrolase [Bacteroidales bacterium]